MTTHQTRSSPRQLPRPATAASQPMTAARDVLSPREVADRAGFSYHAILRQSAAGICKLSSPCPATTGSNSSSTSAGCAAPRGAICRRPRSRHGAASANARPPTRTSGGALLACARSRAAADGHPADLQRKMGAALDGGRAASAAGRSTASPTRRTSMRGSAAGASSARRRSPTTSSCASSSRPTGGCTPCRT